VMVDNHMLGAIITIIEESVVSAWNFAVTSLHENCSHYISGTPGYTVHRIYDLGVQVLDIIMQ
jgi:hypothetical protein